MVLLVPCVQCLYDMCCIAAVTWTKCNDCVTVCQREYKASTVTGAYMSSPFEIDEYPITAGNFHHFHIPSFKCFVLLWHQR
jgi:hypothetical protein